MKFRNILKIIWFLSCLFLFLFAFYIYGEGTPEKDFIPFEGDNVN